MVGRVFCEGIRDQVGPEGGTVSLAGTPSTAGIAVELRVPANALRDTVAIRIVETSIPPPDGVVDWSPLYHFEPDDLRFTIPVEVRMPWASASSLAAGLTIYWSDEPGSCALVPLRDNYQNAGFNQGSVLGLGWAMVGAALATAASCP